MPRRAATAIAKQIADTGVDGLYRGEYPADVEAATGRVGLHPALRPAMKSGGVAALHLDRDCIVFHSTKSWARIEEILSGLDPLGEEGDVVDRALSSGGYVGPCDAQGRIMAPKHLLEELGIAGSGVCIGRGDRIELWEANALKAYRREAGSREKIREDRSKVMASLRKAAQKDEEDGADGNGT